MARVEEVVFVCFPRRRVGPKLSLTVPILGRFINSLALSLITWRCIGVIRSVIRNVIKRLNCTEQFRFLDHGF